MAVDVIECVARGLHRQRWHHERLTVRGDGGDTRSDTKANVAELTQNHLGSASTGRNGSAL